MKRRNTFIAALIFATALLLWFSLRSAQPTRHTSSELSANPANAPSALSTQSASPPPSKPVEERRKAVVQAVENALATPITFYGMVIDQHGKPVPQATVIYGALNQFAAPGSQYHGQSDSSGNFSVNGVRGAILRVGVRKEGYYMIDGKSADAFAYGISPDSNTKPPPTKENPAVFMLQKMGAAEPLIKVDRNYSVPKNGAPVEVDLTSGKKTTHGNIRVETWTQDQTQDEKRHYDWRCRLSVPDGGLIQRSGQFDFEAPVEGYREFDEMAMPQTADNWQARAKREYFLKFNDGHYARIRFEIFAGGDHFFEVESYLNPSTGSRNLEYDPSKQINK